MTTTTTAPIPLILPKLSLPAPTFTNKATGAPLPNDTGWQTRHMDAMTMPNRKTELPLLALIAAWKGYMEAHQARSGSPIGDDSYSGPFVQDIGSAIVKLLSGETGTRLDLGALDTMIRNIARDNGLDPEEL
jgi:hypothetical protein